MAETDFPPDEAAVAAIRSGIEAFESEREAARRAIFWRILSYVGPVLVLVAGLAWLMNPLADPSEQWLSTPHVFLYVLGLVGVVLAYRAAVAPAREAGRSVRQRALPIAFGFMKDASFRQGVAPGSFKRLPEETVGSFDGASFEDVVTGTYDDFRFELYEASLGGKSGAVAFHGVIVAFETLAPFPGVLVAARRSARAERLFGGLFSSRLEDVPSGVAALDEIYEFRTDNAEAARPLVAGALAQALGWLGEAWPGEPARVALKGKDGFLLIPTSRNFFELPPDPTPIDYKAHVAPMIADMGSLLATAALVRKAAAQA